MRLTFPLFTGVALINLGNLFITHESVEYGLGAGWMVLLLLMLVFSGRQWQQVRRFLEEHPAEG